jgi:hypothetical protein
LLVLGAVVGGAVLWGGYICVEACCYAVEGVVLCRYTCFQLFLEGGSLRGDIVLDEGNACVDTLLDVGSSRLDCLRQGESLSSRNRGSLDTAAFRSRCHSERQMSRVCFMAETWVPCSPCSVTIVFSMVAYRAVSSPCRSSPIFVAMLLSRPANFAHINPHVPESGGTCRPGIFSSSNFSTYFSTFRCSAESCSCRTLPNLAAKSCTRAETFLSRRCSKSLSLAYMRFLATVLLASRRLRIWVSKACWCCRMLDGPVRRALQEGVYCIDIIEVLSRLSFLYVFCVVLKL